MHLARLHPLWRFLPVLLLLAFLLSGSPLLRNWDGQYHPDSQVYLYTASQLLQGKVLYRELFDHKGPLMYVPDMLGLLLSGHRPLGVWLVQWLFLGWSFYPLFRLIERRTGTQTALPGAVCWVAWLYRYMTVGDNIPEVYASGWLALCLYFTLRIATGETWHWLHAFGMGLCASCLVLIKLNFVALLLPLGAACLFATLKQAKADRWSLFGLVGFLILPAILSRYFLSQQAMQQALQAAWTFNLQYVESNGLSWQDSLLEVFVHRHDLMWWFVLLSIPLLWGWFRRDHLLPSILLSILMLAAVVLVALPGRGNESRHYLLVLAPVMALWACWIIPHLKERVQWVALLPALYFLYPMLPDVWHQRHAPLHRADACERYLKAHAGRKETLQILGSQSLLYLRTGLQPAHRFFYTYPILSQPGSILLPEFRQRMQQRPPDWLLVERQAEVPDDLLPSASAYDLRMETAENMLYQKKKPIVRTVNTHTL